MDTPQVRLARHRASGFSLIEVLVSIFVLAVGMIGAFTMQATALRTTMQSSYRTNATQLASDIADTIRLGREDDSSTWTNHFADIDFQSSDSEPTPPAALCYSRVCSTAEYAEFALHEWKLRITKGFPAGRFKICHDSKPWDDSSKSYRWECSADDGAVLVVKAGWRVKNPDGTEAKTSDGIFPPVVVLPVL